MAIVQELRPEIVYGLVQLVQKNIQIGPFCKYAD